MPTREQLQALTTVAEDLEHLRDAWWENPADDVLRRGSAILRRFLAEGVLQRAWNLAGFEREPIIVAPDLDELMGPDSSKIAFAFAGGAHLQGIFVAGARMSELRESPKGGFAQTIGIVVAGARMSEGGESPKGGPSAMEHRFKLSAFAESTAAIARSQVVKRRELVKYFAVMRGGVHLDELSSRRRKEEQYLVQKLGGLEKAIVVLNKDAFHFELLSIGQAVGRAPDLQKLVTAIRGAAT